MKIAILISGRGSNMQNIVQHFNGCSQLKVLCVLSNKPSAEGLAWAQKQGICTHVIEHATYPDRDAFDQAMIDYLAPLQPDYIVLAGFMRILTVRFIDHFAGQILNIHPSLLPSFTGLHTHQRALDEGVKIHGATVHFVVPELDAGPIIAQAGVLVQQQNAAELAADVLSVEHQLYPQVLQWLMDESLIIQAQGREEWVEEDCALDAKSGTEAKSFRNQIKNKIKDHAKIKIMHRLGKPQFFMKN